MATFNGTTGDDLEFGVAGNDTYQLGAGNDTIVYNATIDGSGLLSWTHGNDTIISTDGGVVAPNYDKIVLNFSLDHIYGRKNGANFELSIYAQAINDDNDPGAVGQVGMTIIKDAFTGSINDRFSRIEGLSGFYFDAVVNPVADAYGHVGIYKSYFNDGVDYKYDESLFDINDNETQFLKVFNDDSARLEFYDVNGTHPWFRIDYLYSGYGTLNQTLTRQEQFNDNGTIAVTVPGTAGNDTIQGNTGADNLSGQGGNDVIEGLDNNDLLLGGDGNDTLRGGNGIDSLLGGSGDDRLVGGNNNDALLDGGDGYDTVVHDEYLSSASDGGYVFNYTAQGANGYSSIQISGRGVNTGYFEQDFGVLGIEQINGTAGGDVMRDMGSDRETYFLGGRGNDILVGSAFDGDLDYAMYNDLAGAHIEVDLQWLTEYSIGAPGNEFFGNLAVVAGNTPRNSGGTVTEVDVLQGIGGIFGSSGNDLIMGSFRATEYFRPFRGNDTVDGRDGFDIVDYGNADRGLSITLAAAGLTTTVADDGYGTLGQGGVDQLTNIEAIHGSNHADTLTGNASDNRLRGRGGNDTLDGGGGFDLADYRSATTALNITLANAGLTTTNVADGQNGLDTLISIEALRGGSFNDSLTGNDVANLLQGLEGDDTLSGGGGNDTLDGQDGFDQVTYSYLSHASGYTFTFDRALNTLAVQGTGGNTYTETDTVLSIDVVRATAAGDTLTDAVAGRNMYFLGGLGNDTINGNATDYDFALYSERDATNTVTANLGINLVTITKAGSATETDTLSNIRGVWGGAGADVLTGGNLDEYFRGNAGNDTIDGGGGMDIADYRFNTTNQGIAVTLAASGDTIVIDQAGGSDTLRNIEGISGSNNNDQITGNGANNWFRGRGGNDTINGGDGIDTLSHTTATSGIEVNLLTGIVSDGEGGVDSVSNIENVTGGDHEDEIRGSSAANRLEGGAGDDTLMGREGNDTLDGGSGFNYADYDYLTHASGYTFTIGNTVAVTGKGGNSGYSETDTISNIDAFYGSDFNDSLTDTIAGRQTYLLGGTGNDTLTGNIEDTDIAAYWNRGSSVSVNAHLGNGTATVTDSSNPGVNEVDTLVNINGLMFGTSSGNDTLTGNSLNNYLRGGGGNDTINGGAGFDVASYSNSLQGIEVYMAADGVAFNLHDGINGTDSLNNIEGIDATHHDDYIVGNSADNYLRGRAGYDYLDGGAGTDWADYAGGEVAVNITLLDGTAETIVTNDGWGSMDRLVRIEGLYGTSHDDILTGNAANNIFRGNEGNDTISGGLGIDVARYSNAQSAVTIVLAADGVDTLANDGMGGTDTLRSIEGLDGSNFADSLTGNALGNLLRGNMGNDTLDGGLGTDSLFGGLGNDTYHVDTQSDLVFENPNEGIDTLIATVNFYLYAHVEGLTLATGAGNLFGAGNDRDNTLTGNDGNNLLLGWDGNDTIAGNAGNDNLYGVEGADSLLGGAGIDNLIGGNGNDTLDGGAEPDALYGEGNDDVLYGGTGFFTDILIGGAGNDTLDGSASVASGLTRNQGDYDRMNGGAGNDTYYVDTPSDLTFEALNDGTDTVIAEINGGGYYLYANVENLTLTGSTPFGVGNGLDNTLTGSALTNWLLGGAGNDTINGGGGNDVLFGEGGADTFVFRRGTGGDLIGDFTPGTDKIDIAGIGYSSFAQVQARMVQNGGSTAIDLGQGDFVVLVGVSLASLGATDILLA